MKICLITFTRNSEKGLKRLLENVYEIVDDIVIIDGFSTDNTLKIAKDYNARIYQRKPLGYPDPERLRAMKLCKYDWILHLDTDEIINENLKHDLKSLILKNLGRDIVAYKISRIAYYEHLNMPSYYSWPDWQIRIYNRRKVAFKGLIHEHIKVQGKYLYLPLKKYYIIHFHKLDLKKIIKYTYIHKKVYVRPFNASRIRNFLTKYNPLMLLFLHFPIGLIKKYKKVKYINRATILHSVEKGIYDTYLAILTVTRSNKEKKMAYIFESNGLTKILDAIDNNKLYELLKDFYKYNISCKIET